MSGATVAARVTRSVDPRSGEAFGPGHPDTEPGEIARVLAAAASAAERLRTTPPAAIAEALSTMADALDAGTDELVAVADRETALGEVRLTGEVARTTGQLRMFADHVATGAHLDAVVSTELPPGSPARDLRRIGVPVGPVAVFGASNFPFAFSVAGGDTASALAAGCPVVVKAHPGHPATSELVGEKVLAALKESPVPEGVFALVHGSAPSVGEALVTSPLVRAVAFTGSARVGRALFDLAARRPVPIPVYAEMGSLNPVVLAPSALAGDGRAQAVASTIAASVTAGWGQFCTKPGVVLVPESAAASVTTALQGALAAAPPARLVGEGIRQGFERSLEHASAASSPWRGAAAPGISAPAALLSVGIDDFLAQDGLQEELFGPAVVVVAVRDLDGLDQALAAIGGSLTGTVHGEPDDPWVRRCLDVLPAYVGRVVAGGVPTGVAVDPAMHHGGPYPASTVPWATSVGTAAVRRFLRPVAFQDVPPSLLPSGLADENPWRITRMVNGRITDR